MYIVYEVLRRNADIIKINIMNDDSKLFKTEKGMLNFMHTISDDIEPGYYIKLSEWIDIYGCSLDEFIRRWQLDTTKWICRCETSPSDKDFFPTIKGDIKTLITILEEKNPFFNGRLIYPNLCKDGILNFMYYGYDEDFNMPIISLMRVTS